MSGIIKPPGLILPNGDRLITPDVAPKMVPFWHDGHWRYKVAKGGRGSTKSWGFARMLTVKAATDHRRVLCARELQNSIKESVHKLISVQIELLGLTRFFKVYRDRIVCPQFDSEFIFMGLRSNPDEVKSLEGLTDAWVEEAAKVSNYSWEMLIPTVRRPGSTIWISYNPADETDPVHQRWGVCDGEKKPKRPDTLMVNMNYYDNPWFGEPLEGERKYLEQTDPDAYANVWLGKTRRKSAAQILNGKWRVGSEVEFRAIERLPNNHPLYGSDWGFSVDPTTGLRMRLVGTRLFISHEVYRKGLENDHIAAAFIAGLPGVADHVMRGDNARPETISYLQRHGLPKLQGVEKWKGSVEDGIAFLRALSEIVIHPSCVHTIEEARLWSYKVDRLTGDVQPEVAEGHDHCWDAIRYALQPIIQTSGRADGMIRYLAELKAAADAQLAAR